MTAPGSIDPARFLHDQLESASPDLLRSMLATFISALMSAGADAVCGAPYGTPSPDRVNVRNGCRHRDFDTRAGTLEVAIPKLRSGSYFPDWLLERRRRAEAVLTSVVATCYLLGVSTRRMEKLAGTLGITRLSRSQVSEMARDLDEQVKAFRTRPLDAGPCTFVAADALVLKVREGGRVVNVHALLAAGVNSDGHREILGLQVTSAEDGAGWLAFFRDLTARGLTGVQLVTSDAHRGVVGRRPRLHLNISVGGGRAVPIETRRQRVDAEAARLADLGAEFAGVPNTEGLDHYAVAMKDPEGNEFDIN